MEKEHEKILDEAIERFETVMSDDSFNRDEALEDLKFVHDIDEGQWPSYIRTKRAGKPTETINKTKKFVKQVTSAIRQDKPTIKVHAVDSVSDPVLAETFNDLIRHIQYNSKAHIAYETGVEYAIASGRGYWRIVTEYSDDDSFEQDIVIKRIPNPFTVFFDPNATEYDNSDAMYCFISETMPRDKFKRLYPKADPVDWNDFKEDRHFHWSEEDSVRIAEYFYKVATKKKIALLNNGEVIDVDKIEPESLEQMGLEVVNEREVDTYKVMWCKLSGAEIIEGPQEWPGKHIPVVQVIGDEVNIEGKRHFISLIRDAKGPQRSYNYWSSQMTRMVALFPLAPYMVTPEQVKNHEHMWNAANRKDFPYLLYNQTSDNSGPPKRQTQATIPSGALAELQRAHADLEDVLGMYGASVGKQGNERSGVAIKDRRATSDRGNFTFVDNFARSIVYTGTILIDLIPKIYDTKRIIRVMGEDGSQNVLHINTDVFDPRTGERILINDLSVGKYDVMVDIGPSFSSKRQETVNEMTQYMQYAPELAPIILQIAAKYSDSPGHAELAEALKQHFSQGGGQEQPPPGAGGPMPQI